MARAATSDGEPRSPAGRSTALATLGNGRPDLRNIRIEVRFEVPADAPETAGTYSGFAIGIIAAVAIGAALYWSIAA